MSAVYLYADALTKDDSEELFLSLLYGGVPDFRDAKQTWARICSGREQLEWEGPLPRRTAEEPARQGFLLHKGKLHGGAFE